MTSSPPPVHRRQINTAAFADGSSPTTSTSATTLWSCETNWSVTRGSLDSAVTFESFDFPIESESTGPKPPLLLVPSSTSDCEPCEIKLNFTQKHEIRQIYVRSTARIYEIYYATDDLQSENEYLCTVRCSAASVEENSFPETEAKNAISVNLEGPNEILPKGKVSGENNIGTNEDDWVEIKLPVARVDEGNAYSPNQTSNATKNYYEATAEINDSEPCISLTLRLLSLQSKAFVHVDEIYVFADCIDTDDSQKQTETSAGSSSLMTMLVPTLIGLSKSRSLQLPNQHTSKSVKKPFETESRPIAELTRCQVAASSFCDSTSGKAFSDNGPESVGRVLLEDSNGIGIRDSESGATAELTRCHVPPSTSYKQIPFLGKTIHDPNTALLEQLVSRVSRIEDVLLRFEEKMLKPINNMEARLHHVEQQMELLTKNSQFQVSSSSSSPSSCCPTSEPKPENISQLYCDSESEEQQDTSVAQVHQDLTVEPQHSEEKQQVNNVSEPPTIEKPKKKYVSIDDALAAALAGFSSFTKPTDIVPALPLEEEEECLISNDEASFPSESLKPTTPEFIEEEKNEVTKSSCESVTVDVLNNLEQDLTTSTTYCDAEITNENNKTDDDEIVKQGSIEAVKVLTFDKNDILKYFPDQCPDVVKNGSESGVDFETDILEVKFDCLENGGNLKSHFEPFLPYTDDYNPPAPIDEDVLIEETTGNGNGLLVEIDGDDVAECVVQDHPDVFMETSFDSLI